MRAPAQLIAIIVTLALLASACAPGSPGGRGAGGSTSGSDEVDGFTHAHGLQVAPWAPDSLFLATHHGLIRIDDGGATWRHVSEEQHDFMGFSVHPGDEDVLYSSGHPAPGSDLENPIGLMVSEDGGRTWEQRSLAGEADFHAMSVQARDGDVIYGFSAMGTPGLYRSTDAGRSWARVEATELRGANVIALAVHPDDADHVLAATEIGLLRSSDAGGSWEPVIEDVAVTAVSWAAIGEDRQRLMAYVADPERGLLASDDEGATWSELGLALDDDAVAHVAQHPDDRDILYVATFGEQLLRSDDGGKAFEAIARDGKRLS